MPTSQNLKLQEFDRRVCRDGGRLAGVDEAGRGPLAGPVVACAAVVKDPRFSNRIDDSKKLTPRRREMAFQEILSRCVVSVAVIGETRIDEINIFRATLEAMERAIRGLGESPDVILIDGRHGPDGIMHDPEGGGRIRPVPEGDGRSLSIACASIVAKVTRDRIMRFYHELYPEYGFDRHKGYGTLEHIRALDRHGPSPIHRRSFSPVRLAAAWAGHEK